MDNLAFKREESFPCSIRSEEEMIEAHIDAINATADVILPVSGWWERLSQIWKNHLWRMRYFFYVHLCVFLVNSLLSGGIVWSIEKQRIPFVDCWFIGATCVFTCGLQTYEFAAFCLASQIVLLIFTLISGITVSTIPAILIKIFRIREERLFNEGLPSSPFNRDEEDYLPTRQFLCQDLLLEERLRSLPKAEDLRRISYVLLILLILSLCSLIYFISFLSIGLWLTYHYQSEDLSQGNRTIQPFYASIVLTLTGFNQNGLSPWSGGITLFVNDIFLNLIIMILVMSGTSLFPAILRGMIDLIKSLVPWRYKIFFDYILLNNHRLSTVIFPSIQTRLYVTVTILLQILGVTVALILDYNNSQLMTYDGGQRFLIFMFQTVNTRFGGYATINISELAAGTLVIFVLLMAMKPQMLCAINETPFKMEWILIQTQQKLENKVSDKNRKSNVEIFLPFDRMKDYLLRQSSLTRAQANKYFSRNLRNNQAQTKIEKLNEKRNQRRLSTLSIEKNQYKNTSHLHISFLKMKLLFIIFSRHFLLHCFTLLTSTRTWLFLSLFLICAFESPLMLPSNPSITVFRVFFEIISAFGGCGLSMGFSNSSPSLATVLSTPSKIVLIFVMCMGRHRGLLDSMKDQEHIEYDAQTLIDTYRQLIIQEYQSILIPTPPLSTRF